MPSCPEVPSSFLGNSFIRAATVAGTSKAGFIPSLNSIGNWLGSREAVSFSKAARTMWSAGISDRKAPVKKLNRLQVSLVKDPGKIPCLPKQSFRISHNRTDFSD